MTGNRNRSSPTAAIVGPNGAPREPVEQQDQGEVAHWKMTGRQSGVRFGLNVSNNMPYPYPSLL